MKKIILALILTTAIATTGAQAQQVRTCVGGTEFQGAVNGHYYCRGPAMTWWAAFAWCQKQGRHLASLQEACVDYYGATGESACPNMKVSTAVNGTNMSSAWMWTANPNGSKLAYFVNSGTGNVNTYLYRYGTYQALCY